MNFLILLADAVGSFIRRNPLLCLLILLLAILSPALLRGIALFVICFILGIILFSVLVLFLLQWRLRRIGQRMGRQFDGQGRREEAAWSSGRGRTAREGEVKVHRTSEEPEKRVANDVGDYVDFEETKNDD